MDMISDDDTDIDLDWQSYLETYHLLGEELAKGKEKQQVNTLLSLFFEFLMIVLLDEESDDDEPAARTFTPRTRACFWETTASMTGNEFSQCFRFTRKTFKSLLDLMRPLISRFTAEEGR